MEFNIARYHLAKYGEMLQNRSALSMRISVRKRYSQLDKFVRAANLGWEAIFKDNDFPTLETLEPRGEHRRLLARIERTFRSRFREIRPAGDTPLLISSRWGTFARSEWQRLHCFALVRRLFDSLDFLTREIPSPRSGARQIPLTLQISVEARGSVSRVRDPFEDFLAALTESHDLRRLRSCPACSKFFVAWRKDQKTCGRRCATLIRVHRFREKKAEYAANRRFRKRTGLKAPRRGRNRLLRLSESLRSIEKPDAPGSALPGEESSNPPRRFSRSN
jgi:hypothetical protein